MSNLTPVINAKADLCVKCGLCLPHCPTYRLFQDENESPRGRIALIQALANGQLHADQTLSQHLDHCLGCRSCERVCPSGVDYGYLLDHARQVLNQQRPATGLQKQLIQTGLRLTSNQAWQRYLQTALYYYQKTGLQALVRLTGILKLLRLTRFDQLSPTMDRYQAFEPSYPARAPGKGRVGLFIGCTGHLFDQITLQGTIGILQRLGYEVIIPDQQTCCGALHQHQGLTESAGTLAGQNIRAFAGLDTIIYIASGCGAQLREYSRFAWLNKERQAGAESFANSVKEITAFLADEDLTQFRYKTLNKRVAIHTPCSMRNGLRQVDASKHLLSHIPGLQLTAIPAETGCCGAAGSYMISQPGLADTVRESTLDAIGDLDAELVSTSNIGCALHLNAGLANKADVTHPVALLIRQMLP